SPSARIRRSRLPALQAGRRVRPLLRARSVAIHEIHPGTPGGFTDPDDACAAAEGVLLDGAALHRDAAIQRETHPEDHRAFASCAGFPVAIKTEIVTRLRSRGDNSGRLHTSPNSTSSVNVASPGAILC